MSYRAIFRILSTFLLGLSIPLLLPLSVAIYCEWIAPENYPEARSALAFFITILITVLVGLLFRFIGRKSSNELYRREAFVLVVFVYIFISAISALPFTLNGTLSNYADAFFEMVSGYTTTGATILDSKQYDQVTKEEIPIVKSFVICQEKTYTYYGTVAPVIDNSSGAILKSGIEALSPALLLWRSLTQFLGGGGIVILFLALLPILGVGGKVLYQTEATGPSKETMAPRITETASQLWKIYVGLTVVQIFLLMVTNANMPFFDAICISFSTLSTGGFAPRNDSIAAYNSVNTELIVIIFMILGSINFSIYFFLIRGRLYRLKDPELIAFFVILIVSLLFAVTQLLKEYPLREAFRYGAFQAISAQTSTGFFTKNYDLWPFTIQTWMLILLFIGGMAGSTTGGMKVVRFLIVFKVIVDKLQSLFRPDAVRTLRLSGTKMIDEKVATTTLCFFIVVAICTVLGTFIFVLDGIDPETALTTSATLFNNAGFGFRMGGPDFSFAFLSSFGKIISCIWMIAGRLEYFTLLMLFLPAFWKKS